MSRYHDGWAPYVPVARRREKAARAVEKLRRDGHPVAPVVLDGRKIATTFWGKAWCDNLEGYHDFKNRLPRGRTYVRNGSVMDLQVSALEVRALVSGSSTYKVAVAIAALPEARWRRLREECAGGIDSLVELLQGRFSKGVMERLCRQDTGLFPRPSEITFSCSCLDYASMCKHVAAVLYGIGSRLDEKPELLFRLRAVDENDLVAQIDSALPLARQGLDIGKMLERDDISALFGLEMASPHPAGKGEDSPGEDEIGAETEAVRPPPRSGTAKRVKPGDRHAAPLADWENAVRREVEDLVSRRNGPAYARATALLLDLAERSRAGRNRTRFARFLASLRARHQRKRKFMERLDAANLG